jgi:sugar fermentation stimulation protein A
MQVEAVDHIKKKKIGKFSSTDRFRNTSMNLLVCFIYDNPGFRVVVKSTNSDYVKEQVESCTAKGVESWQANFEITPERVKLSKYFNLSY